MQVDLLNSFSLTYIFLTQVDHKIHENNVQQNTIISQLFSYEVFVFKRYCDKIKGSETQEIEQFMFDFKVL